MKSYKHVGKIFVCHQCILLKAAVYSFLAKLIFLMFQKIANANVQANG